MTFLPATNLGEAIGNTIAGLGTVFCVLIFLIFVISMFKYVNKFAMAQEEKAKAAAPAPKAAPKAAPAAPAAPVGPGTMANASVNFADEVEGPIAAVILAAVAETCGGNFKVTSIKKSK